MLGTDVRSTTTWGAPALDLGAAVRVTLERAGARLALRIAHDQDVVHRGVQALEGHEAFERMRGHSFCCD